MAARGGAEEEEEDDDDYEFVPADLTISRLKVGEKLEGVVSGIMPFGVFVDVGAEKSGLVPLSKLQDGFTENAGDVVKDGQGVTVWVSAVAGDRLTLSMTPNKIYGGGAAAPRADLSLFEGIDSSQVLPGTVVSVRDFGAFVSVKPPSGGDLAAQGLVHITQLKDGFVENAEDEVAVGQEVEVRVLSVDVAANRLALTMRSEDGAGPAAAGGKDDVGAFAGTPDTEWLEGTVKSLVNFGAFVEVQAPGGGATAQGLVHISEIKDGFIEDPADELEVGMEVKVRVLEVDEVAGKLGLTMKEVPIERRS